MISTPVYQVPVVKPQSKKRITVSVPGSKSITNRALLLATLAQGESTLSGVLFSDDSRNFLKSIQDLGFETEVDEAKRIVKIKGLGGVVPKEKAGIYVGSAGTAARFLAAYLGISHGTYHLDSSEQMKKRPMAPLLASLKSLGCEISFDEKEGFFPFTLTSNGFGTNDITVNIDHSSQFLSALLISSNLSPDGLTIHLEGEHGLSYIQMTVNMMKQFGVTSTPLYYCAGNNDNHSCNSCENSKRPYGYETKPGQAYKALDYMIEPDVSAASYFYAMAPLLQTEVLVNGVTKESMQGDVAFIEILEKMGCKITHTPEGILLSPGDGIFKGVDVDMSACSDQAITLAAIAPYASSPTTIRGIGHIRFQECDRLTAIVTELNRMGITTESTEDSITIYPGTPKPATIETYDDHRMAMGFTLTGLRSEGIVINNPSCCKKTFEDYYETLEQVLSDLS